ncbi:MAG: tetratricopeptide repeat protein [candidate division Zixibacteria bacterium]|nr:tetratricopeptide repeat protein [candidate division Zixibacteria bacterium]
MEPYKKDHWQRLGEIYIQAQKFAEAIPAYEKAAEIDPGDIRIWEVLKDLYSGSNMPDKAQQAEAKMQELKKL